MPVTDRDQAYARIQAMIDDGTLVPEQPLSERRLAETLALGRTPVREALRALAHARLLEVIPTRGTFVRTPTLDEMRETYEIRVALEGMAAYLAAERGPSPRLLACAERLRELLARAEKDVKVIQAVGWELHDEWPMRCRRACASSPGSARGSPRRAAVKAPCHDSACTPTAPARRAVLCVRGAP